MILNPFDDEEDEEESFIVGRKELTLCAEAIRSIAQRIPTKK